MKYINGNRVIEVVAVVSGGFRVRILEDDDPESVGYEWDITPTELGSCYNAFESGPPLTGV